MVPNIDLTYSSPRWSGEILDCSMPMTFDQYSKCSYDCLYCFSYFQRALKQFNPLFINDSQCYLLDKPTSVDPADVLAIFTHPESLAGVDAQFIEYTKRRIVMQWGGLSDPFDTFERKHGIGLQILEGLVSLEKGAYPICFSTKATWWTEDDRYKQVFRRSAGAWNVKLSIICLDAVKAKKVERGVPSPAERLKALERCSKGFNRKGGGTLRLRPFIIGLSSIDYGDLIGQAAASGASALSTEFLCLEGRAHEELRRRYTGLSEAIGFDIIDYYKRNSTRGSGYMRLNWKVKEPYVRRMEELCNKYGMRFYVSDAHHKDRCCNGSCCGLPAKGWNYQKGQFTEMLVRARQRYDAAIRLKPTDITGAERASEITFTEMATVGELKAIFGTWRWVRAKNFNTQGADFSARLYRASMYDYIHLVWNEPNNPKSPYKYFGGLLHPRPELDSVGDVVYFYRPYCA